jgi:hypothetical protein
MAMKASNEHHEVMDADLPKHEEELIESYVPGTEEERKLVRKIDLYLLPAMWLMYLLSYMDRTK